ncbi:MAG TPA: ROK family protein [Actinocrinis sp.]|jgi:predicted NBD/HSP70 family sugar kinase
MARAAVGIDVGGTKLLMIAQTEDREDLLTARSTTGFDATAADIEAAIRGFITDQRLTPTSVGIAVPGFVAGGFVSDCDVVPGLTGWSGPADLGAPLVLVHDIRSALAQEAAGLPEAATMVTVLCGTAVGSACLHRGTVLRGARGWAGELGYLPIPTPSGIRRLDDLAGGASLVQATGLRPAQIHAAHGEGDAAVVGAVTAAGEAFGLGLATVVNLYNPDVVRIAGGTVNYPGYWDAALTAARTHSIPDFWDACAVDLIKDPELVVARGALRLADASRRGETWIRQYT